MTTAEVLQRNQPIGNISGFWGILLTLSTLLLPLNSFSADTIRAVNDDVYVQAEIDNQQASLDWRFQTSTTLKRIEATLDGTPLTVSSIKQYPQQGEQSGILFLVDVSDPERDPVIQQQILTLMEMINVSKTHHQYALAEFASAYKTIQPFTTNTNEIILKLPRLKAYGRTTELYRSLLDGVAYLKQQQFARKAIFIFSDGQAEDRAYSREDVVKAAKQAEVALYALGYPNDAQTSTALQTIRRLAEETGGQFIPTQPPDYQLPAAFLKDPYAVLDTGGSTLITIGNPYRLPWEKPAKLLITLSYTGGAVEISQPMKLRYPTSEEYKALALSPAYKKITYGVAATVAGIIALIMLRILWKIIRFVLRVTKKPEQPAPPPEPIAYINLLDSNEDQIALTTGSIRIGRDSDNELVLPNTSISAHHACIIRRRDGTFMIQDLNSANGVQLNGEMINEAQIRDDDLVELGEVRFRFVEAIQQSAE